MKYIKTGFLVIFLLTCTVIFAQKNQIRIACVGNSITYGAGVHDREKNSYPAQLQSLLGSDYEVMNFGVSARTLLRKGNYPYWKEDAFRNALNSAPNIVTILLGTNDSKAINRPFYDEFEKDYSDLIDSFRNLPSHPKVIMLLPAAVFTKTANSIYDSVIVNSIIPMSRNVAYNKKCEVVDLHPMFLGKGNLLPDGVHPNAAGQQLIAERLYEQLQLSENKTNLFSKIKEPLAVSNFYGFDCADFRFENRDCKIVKPRTAGKGKPWIWRARFWGHEPQTDIALLERGFYVVYCDVAELYGNKQAIEIWNGFYKKMRKLGLDKKAAMEGMSRGGAYVYNWAAVNPKKVACVYADAPVLDFKSWPGGKGTGPGGKNDWEIFKKDFNLTTEQQALDFKGNPLDKVKQIVAGHYPMLHVVGDADEVVPVAENTDLFEKSVKDLGGNIEVIHKPGNKHHPHSLKNPEPIVNFILSATGNKIVLPKS